MKSFSHTRPVRDNTGAIISQKPAPVSRVTRNELGGQFGSDRRKRLVVTLRDGDLIEFRPERSRRIASMLATDLYWHVIRSQQNKVNLEKARNKKSAIAARKLAAKIRRVDANLRRPL